MTTFEKDASNEDPFIFVKGCDYNIMRILTVFLIVPLMSKTVRFAFLELNFCLHWKAPTFVFKIDDFNHSICIQITAVGNFKDCFV